MGRFRLPKLGFIAKKRKSRSVDLPADDSSLEFERIRERAIRRWQTYTPGCTTVLVSGRSPIEEFHRLFPSLPSEEFPLNVYTCALSKDILLQGKMFVSQNWICFYSNIFGYETKVKIEMDRVVAIKREKTAFVVPNAISVQTPNKRFFFCSFLSRETVFRLLSRTWRASSTNELTDGRPNSTTGEILDIQARDCNQNDSTISMFDSSMDEPRAVCSDIDDIKLKSRTEPDGILFPQTVHVHNLHRLNGYHRVSISLKPETRISRWNTVSDLREAKAMKRKKGRSYSSNERIAPLKKESLSEDSRPRLTSSVVRWTQTIWDSCSNKINSVFSRPRNLSVLFHLICIAIIILGVMSIFLIYKINRLSQVFVERDHGLPHCSLMGDKDSPSFRDFIATDKLRRVNTVLASNLHAVHEVRKLRHQDNVCFLRRLKTLYGNSKKT
ncbi:GRAM domain-containing protein 2A-like isoform X2 [Rhopilema esculentum]|uniref:GRAM domain-containing protein 2A-like isoform X2 n=1 Tax=Rhopilema esculentum TaxID=499914 RepID=UPI0031CE2FEC